MPWSAAVTITPPAAEPIDTETAKVFLRIDGDDQDAEIAVYVAGARAEVERVTSTRLIEQTVELSADSFADLDHLPIGPVISVTSVAFRDSAGAPTTIDSAVYERFGAGLENGIRPVPGATWPGAGTMKGAITVRLVVGYGASIDALPADLVLALYKVLRAEAEGTPAALDEQLVNHRIWL